MLPKRQKKTVIIVGSWNRSEKKTSSRVKALALPPEEDEVEAIKLHQVLAVTVMVGVWLLLLLRLWLAAACNGCKFVHDHAEDFSPSRSLPLCKPASPAPVLPTAR